MRLIEKYSDLTYKEYLKLLLEYKKHKINTLGFFRSILESTKLTIEEKIHVRDEALAIFSKSFDFLQVKDPKTYVEIVTLGNLVTKGEKDALWDTIMHNQEKILKEKRIKHRNFGTYSKHICGYESCPYNGKMIQQGKFMCEYEMSLPSDSNKANKGMKSKISKKDQKQKFWKKYEEEYEESVY
jgi:hypothetical protein